MSGRSWLRALEWVVGLFVLAAIGRALAREWERPAARRWEVDRVRVALGSAPAAVVAFGHE